MTEKATPFDPQVVLHLDGYLDRFLPAIDRRHKLFQQWKDTIVEHEGGFENFTKGYDVMGFTVKEDGTVVYREWAPNAKEANLIGEFSQSPCIVPRR
jgi:1,4-alpha-glucan branching enzyme